LAWLVALVCGVVVIGILSVRVHGYGTRVPSPRNAVSQSPNADAHQ
jgi:hypothetical protein